MKAALSLTVLAGIVASTLPVAAQEPVAPLRLKSGDAVFVTDRQGREHAGRVASVTPLSLGIIGSADASEFLITDVGRVERRGGVGPGTWLFAGYGAWLGAGSAGSSCSPSCGRVVPPVAVAFGAVAFSIGALWDRTHHRRAVYGIQPDSRHALRSAPPVQALGELWTRVSAGDVIAVVDASGRKTSGTFEWASSTSMALRTDGTIREFAQGDVRQVSRRVDRLWTGALLGAALGAVSGAKWSSNYQGTHPVSGAIGGVMPLMAVGAWIGSNVPRHAVVFERASSRHAAVAPLLSPTRHGLTLSFRF